jgi:hypothetical protein
MEMAVCYIRERFRVNMYSCVGETLREARESIRWTVKTFDRRGW